MSTTLQFPPSQNDLSIRLAFLVTAVPSLQHADEMTVAVEVGHFLNLLQSPRVVRNLQVHAHLHGWHMTVVSDITVPSVESYSKEEMPHVPLLIMIKSGLKAVRIGRSRSSTAFRNSTRPPSPSCRRLLIFKRNDHSHCSVSQSGCSGWL